MESFIYEDLNKATREKDRTKIKFYGAFAAALSYIIYNASHNRSDIEVTKKNILYRGVKLNS